MYGVRNSIGIGVSGNIALTIAAMFTGGGGGTNVAFDLMKTLGGIVYMPGIGTVDSIPTGNYTDATGTVVSSVNGPVGLVKDATGGSWTANQSVFTNQPLLQLLAGKYLWNFDTTDTMSFGASAAWSTATVIVISSAGVTLTQNRNLATTPIVTGPNQVIYGIFVLQNSPTSANLQVLMDYAYNVSPVIAAALVILRAGTSRLWLPGDALSSNGLSCLNYSDAGATVPAVQGGSVLVVKDALGSNNNAVGQSFNAGYRIYTPTLSKSLGKDCLRLRWNGDPIPTNQLTSGSSNITFQNTLTGNGVIITARNDGLNKYIGAVDGSRDLFGLSSASQLNKKDWCVFYGALLIAPIPSANDINTLTAYMQSLIPTVSADPYRANVSLLCHFDDAANTVHPTSITDSGPRASHGVVVGANIVNYSAPLIHRYGTTGLYIPDYGTAADYVNYSSSPAYNFGVGDFTIEFNLIIPAKGTTNTLLGVWDSATVMSWKIAIAPTKALQFWANGALVLSTRQFLDDGALLPPDDVPYHIGTSSQSRSVAFVRSAGILSIYCEGALMASTPFANAITPAISTFLLLFRDYQGNTSTGVTIDELRITKGVARYTAPYVVSDFPFPDN